MGKRKRNNLPHPYGSMLTCARCNLSKTRKSIAPYALIGKVPARILIIGEAPKRSEEIRREGYVGPESRVLKELLRDALAPESILMVYSVGCRAIDASTGDDREPASDEILACRKNISGLVRAYCEPELVIFLGKIVERYWRSEYPDAKTIMDPATLLKQGGASSPAYLGQLRTMEELVNRLNKLKEQLT